MVQFNTGTSPDEKVVGAVRHLAQSIRVTADGLDSLHRMLEQEAKLLNECADTLDQSLELLLEAARQAANA